MAGWLVKRLGNGLFGLIDIDNPNNSPSVSAAITAPAFDDFTRIVQGQFNNNEEVRIDRPGNYAGGFEYIAIAPTGSSTASAVWSCVRCTWSGGHKVRMQYLENIAWDDRAIAGW